MKVELGDELLTKLNAPAGIPKGIQRRRPRANAHHVWYHYQEASRHSGLCWDANLHDSYSS